MLFVDLFFSTLTDSIFVMTGDNFMRETVSFAASIIFNINCISSIFVLIKAQTFLQVIMFMQVVCRKSFLYFI